MINLLEKAQKVVIEVVFMRFYGEETQIEATLVCSNSC
jgi:hypothetical protein